MSSVTVTTRQSILDIAVQHCGSVESAFDIAMANGISITDDLTVGASVEVPEAIKPSIAQYYRNNGIMPATSVTVEEEMILSEIGIEFWFIEEDFIVS